MGRWITRIGLAAVLVAALAFATGTVYAQGRRPGGPMGNPFVMPRERPETAGPREQVQPRAPAPPRVVVREEKDEDEDENEAESESCPGEGNNRPGGLFHHGVHRAKLVALIGLLALLVVVPVLVTVLWVLPIALGVWIARRRNLSPLWMFFGINPLGGWIACLVLALSRGKVQCPACGGYVKPNYRQCPHCHGALSAPSSAKNPA